MNNYLLINIKIKKGVIELSNGTEEFSPERLVNENLDLVERIADRVVRGLPPSIEKGDLIGAGSLGLIDASQKFDPARGFAFRTYAEYRVKGAMLDWLREMDFVPRSYREKNQALESARNELAQELGHEPSQSELFGSMGLDVEDVKADGWLASQVTVSFEEPVEFTDQKPTNKTIADYLPDEKLGENPISRITSREEKVFIRKALENLPGRDGRILRSYYLSEKTMREIGQDEGVTESRISQIHNKAVRKMARLAQREGFPSAGTVRNESSLKEMKKMAGTLVKVGDGPLSRMGFVFSTISQLKKAGISNIADLKAMTSAQFVAIGLHGLCVKAVAKKMVENNVFFTDGEVATRSLLNGGVPESRRPTIVPRSRDSVPAGADFINSAAVAVTGAITAVLGNGNADISEILTRVKLSANDQAYVLTIKLAPDTGNQ